MADKREGGSRFAAGARIRQLRIAKGLSRHELADALGVDVSSVQNWEEEKHAPRVPMRLRLSRLLGCDLDTPVPPMEDGPIVARLVDTVVDLPGLLLALTKRARERLRSLRLAAPYPTTAYVQVEWRKLVAQRLLDGSLAVQRIEIFYELNRLKETLSNILRYDGRNYHVKGLYGDRAEVLPMAGGYYFDDDEFILGGYWSSVPPDPGIGMRVSGRPFHVFFNAYWHEAWQRGTWLNMRGAHDLTAVRSLALRLGLAPRKWPAFVKEARNLEIGDGAPPLF